MTLEPAPYIGAFMMLSNDFRRLTEYVEPTDQNLSTYSHRLYELFLRACTEFESACKELLIAGGSHKNPSDMNINDYKTLEDYHGLEACEVGILIWQPKPAYIKPFNHWSSASPPLGWYRAYNQVKHNRNTEFARASLDNVRHAIAGLFALLAVSGVIDSNVFGYQECLAEDGFSMEGTYPGYIFSLVK
jgi:hypothetical protein